MQTGRSRGTACLRRLRGGHRRAQQRERVRRLVRLQRKGAPARAGLLHVLLTAVAAGCAAAGATESAAAPVATPTTPQRASSAHPTRGTRSSDTRSLARGTGRTRRTRKWLTALPSPARSSCVRARYQGGAAMRCEAGAERRRLAVFGRDRLKARASCLATASGDAWGSCGGRLVRRMERAKPAGPCCHCGTEQSPLFRPGPPHAPVLCNACGTQYRTRGCVRSRLRAPLRAPLPRAEVLWVGLRLPRRSRHRPRAHAPPPRVRRTLNGYLPVAAGGAWHRARAFAPRLHHSRHGVR